MAGLQVTIKDSGIQRRLEKLQRATGNLRPVLKPAGEVMKSSVEENFEVGGRPRWKPLKDATIDRKGHSRPLILKGVLKMVTLKVTDKEAVLGTHPAAKAYAARQHFGWPAGTASVTPARPFMKLQDEDKKEIIDLLDKHIARAMRV